MCVQLLESLKGRGHALCHPLILPVGWNVNMRAGAQASISAFEALPCADDTGEKDIRCLILLNVKSIILNLRPLIFFFFFLE